MSKDEQGYNGWANYETWNLNLWAMNNEGSYHLVCDNRPFTEDSAARLAFEMFPAGTPDMSGPADMVKVDWQEIIDSWNEE